MPLLVATRVSIWCRVPPKRLTLITHVGIECGFDDSAFLYGWTRVEGWRRVWQNEQNTYTEAAYKPQSLQFVQVSPYSPSNDYLVLTLGVAPWCSSNWRTVYYRVFRPGPDLESKPLIDGDELAFVIAAIEGHVDVDDVLVEFGTGSVDSGVHNRRAVPLRSVHEILPMKGSPMTGPKK